LLTTPHSFGLMMSLLLCRRGHNAIRVGRSPNPNAALRHVVSRDLVFLGGVSLSDDDDDDGADDDAKSMGAGGEMRMTARPFGAIPEERDHELSPTFSVGPRGSLVHFGGPAIVVHYASPVSSPSPPESAPSFTAAAPPSPKPSTESPATAPIPVPLPASTPPTLASDSPVAMRSARLISYDDEPGRSAWEPPNDWDVGTEDGEPGETSGDGAEGEGEAARP
jgi:hypothetical protein